MESSLKMVAKIGDHCFIRRNKDLREQPIPNIDYSSPYRTPIKEGWVD